MEERRAGTTEGTKGRRRESDREASGEGVGGGGDWMESENLSANAEIRCPITMHHVLPRERLGEKRVLWLDKM
jgi:hypothetical protein